MIHSLWAVGSLILSVALLLFGHGISLTLLPQVASSFAWSAALNALTTSAYFAGFALGCLIVPHWLIRVGHIRVFGVLVAMATAALLALMLLPYPPVWLVLRCVYGIGIAGLYLVVESWLSAETIREYRGVVLAVYAFVSLLAIFSAQLLLEALRASFLQWTMLAAMFLVLGAIPVGLTRRNAPTQHATAPFQVRAILSRVNLPALASGALTGTFWALAPVMLNLFGYAGAGVARFMAAVIGGGLLAVYPLGWLSDRCGRAALLSAIGLFGVLVTLVFLLIPDRGEALVMTYGVVFGALVMPLYPLCLALANDYAIEGNFVATGRIAIMVNALGMILGPAAAGFLVGSYAIAGLLWFWIGGFAALGVFAILARTAAPASSDEVSAFALVPRSSPEALAIDPRAEPGDIETLESDLGAHTQDPGNIAGVRVQ